MRIKHYNGHTAWYDDTGKLRENKHGTFNMHMTIDQSGSQPTTLQIAFLVPPVAITRVTYTNDEAISNGDIGRVTFAATYVNELSIT
jgi:hypothetical protein